MQGLYPISHHNITENSTSYIILYFPDSYLSEISKKNHIIQKTLLASKQYSSTPPLLSVEEHIAAGEETTLHFHRGDPETFTPSWWRGRRWTMKCLFCRRDRRSRSMATRGVVKICLEMISGCASHGLKKNFLRRALEDWQA